MPVKGKGKEHRGFLPSWDLVGNKGILLPSCGDPRKWEGGYTMLLVSPSLEEGELKESN